MRNKNQRFRKSISFVELLKTFMIISLLTTSFVKPTNAQEITRITKDEPSPYAGVLMPENTFRKYELDVRDKEYLESRIDDIAAFEGERLSTLEIKIIYFLCGALTGTAMVYFLAK